MKIAIASAGKTINSQVDLRFGRCGYFLIYNNKKDELKVVNNTAGQAFRGAGISAAQLLVNQKVKIVIAGNFGPNAVNVLRASKIEIFTAPSMTVKQALDQYKKGKLNHFNQW